VGGVVPRAAGGVQDGPEDRWAGAGHDLWEQLFAKQFPLPTFTEFYFPEAAALFIVMAIVIGLIAKLGEEGTVNTITAGAADFLSAALIVVLARGIIVVMKSSYMTDTVLHWMENAVSRSSKGAFGLLAYIVNVPIAFLVPSSAGHAALVMPTRLPTPSSPPPGSRSNRSPAKSWGVAAAVATA